MSIALRSTELRSDESTAGFFSFTINTKLVKFSEEQIITGLKERKQHVFSYLYDNYSSVLMGIIYRKVSSRECAEDLLQEVFEKIWKNFDSYDSSKGRLYTWMITLAVNHTIDFLKGKSYNKRKLTSGEDVIEKNNSVSNYQAQNFDCICVKKNIGLLKPEWRQLINMAYFYGFTQSEISEELNMPLGTVKTKLRSAIIELRKRTGEII